MPMRSWFVNIVKGLYVFLFHSSLFLYVFFLREADSAFIASFASETIGTLTFTFFPISAGSISMWISLANSRYGIVVLSKSFFAKKWPQDELDGLVAKERSGVKVILPVWHGVTKEDVENFSPILAGRLAVSTDLGLDNVVNEILRAMN